MTTAAAAFGIDVTRGDGGVAWLALRNPARLNALRLEMWEAIPALVGALDADPAVRVVVLRGDGRDAFASGADISEFGARRADPVSATAYEETTARAFEALLGCAKPVVAMIHGVCIGGGLAVAACADLRVAADDARFALPAARLGLGYHLAGVERLVALVGAANAAEVFFTARQYTAVEALRIGLVNQVVPKVELDDFTTAYVGAIAANAPLTLRAAKRAIREVGRDPGERDVAAVARLIAACFASADYLEGVRAFLEKRAPRFRGA
jgi:enoyl-CoA hydratase/carnithine racemase